MVVFVVADHLPKVLGIIRLLLISIRAYYWKICSNNFSYLVKLIRGGGAVILRFALFLEIVYLLVTGRKQKN